MYIASYRSIVGRENGPACQTREEAATAFFTAFPKQNLCATSDAFERDGQWFDRHTNIRFHNRPSGETA